MDFNPEPLVRSIWPDIEYVNSIDYSVDESRADKFFYHVVSKCWLDLPEVILRPGYSGIRPKLQGPQDVERDFDVRWSDVNGVNGFVALYGIDLTGLTPSLALADIVAERLP